MYIIQSGGAQVKGGGTTGAARRRSCAAIQEPPIISTQMSKTGLTFSRTLALLAHDRSCNFEEFIGHFNTTQIDSPCGGEAFGGFSWARLCMLYARALSDSEWLAFPLEPHSG